MLKNKLSIVLPIYNESENIKEVILDIINFCNKEKINLYEILAVNNGSIDNTLIILLDLKLEFKFIKVIDLSKNFGNQISIIAGIQNSTGDFTIVMDSDGQDPIFYIKDLIFKYKEGIDLVIGIKNICEKKFFECFIKYIATLFLPIKFGEADFCLLSKLVVDKIKKCNKVAFFIFFKALRKEYRFKIKYLYYNRIPRLKGKTNFNLYRLLILYFRAIISFYILSNRVFFILLFLIFLLIYFLFYNIIIGIIGVFILLFLILILGLFSYYFKNNKLYIIKKIYN